MPDERKVREDARRSEVTRVTRVEEDQRDAILDGEDEELLPPAEDLVVVTGHAVGKPHGNEIPWDFEAEQREDDEDDPDAELAREFERGSKIVGRKIS